MENAAWLAVLVGIAIMVAPALVKAEEERIVASGLDPVAWPMPDLPGA